MVGAAGELKNDARTEHQWQLLANMGNVAADLGFTAVRAGKIFHTIKVYGLLVDIKDCRASAAILTPIFYVLLLLSYLMAPTPTLHSGNMHILRFCGSYKGYIPRTVGTSDPLYPGAYLF